MKKNKPEVKFELQIRYFPTGFDFRNSEMILRYISLSKKGKRQFKIDRGLLDE